MQKPEIEIHLLGRFEIIVNGEVVLQQINNARKTRTFIQFLILNSSKPVPHEDLYELLWPGEECTNPGTALRTLLYRYRALVTESGLTQLQNSIISRRGAYQWNPNLPAYVDAYEFEKYSTHAITKGCPARDRLRMYREALDIYEGNLLPDASTEPWAVQKGVYFHELYLKDVFGLVELLKEEGSYDEVINVCRKALDIELFNDRLHLELMLALNKTGRRREAASQYALTADMQYHQLGIQPSEEMKEFYQQILASEQDMEADIDKIQLYMEDIVEESGAYVCDYEIFRDIYRIQRRLMERNGQTMFLALLKVNHRYNKKFEPIAADSIMQELLSSMRHILRKGDTISRYSMLQYVLLLPSANYENGQKIMERVKRSFTEKDPRTEILLSYKLRPLLSKPKGN